MTRGFLPDSPNCVDRFGRTHFARTLASGLLLRPGADGLVIGIEGEWGSGKTFVIDQVKAVLQESSERPIIVDFNPWVISGTDAVVEALLQQIGAAIGEGKDPNGNKAAIKAGSSILRYLSLLRHLRYLKYVPGATAIGAAVEDVADMAEKIGTSAHDGADDLKKIESNLPEHNLKTRKDAVVQALAVLDRPIVVVLDDVDRLPPEEIRSVFQAIKAVADFPRTAYLLAYDPRMVARALDKDDTVGLRYIEKIVQVQYPLPEPLPWRMRTFTSAMLTDTLAAVGLTLSSTEETRWKETVSYVGRLCRHPRDVVRVCNRLRVSLPATRGEVDALDVILFETLGVTQPTIAAAIRRCPEDFAGEARTDFETFDMGFHFATAAERSDTSDRPAKDERWRKHLSQPPSLYLEAAVRYLFPDSAEETGDLRVRKWDRLYRLLSLGPSDFITEVGDLRQLVSDPGSLESALESDDTSAIEILRGIEQYRSQLNLTAITFVACLSRAAATRLSTGTNDWQGLFRQYVDVIEQTVRLAPEGREQVILQVIDTAPLSISSYVIVHVAMDLGEWPIDRNRKVDKDEQLISDVACYGRLLSRWLLHVQSHASVVALVAEPLPFDILSTWGQLSGSFEAARSLTKELVYKHEQLAVFLRARRLVGTFNPTLADLDLVWDREDLIRLIESEPATSQRFETALGILRNEEVIEYFKRRPS